MKFVAALFILLSSILAYAQKPELSDVSYLRKISFHLRGVPPGPEEYTALKNATARGTRADFFKKQIRSYLATPQAQLKMAVRIQELFRLRTSALLPDESPARPYETPDWDDALDDLLFKMTRENLSWDFLLTGKSYRLYPLQKFGIPVLRDFAFLRALLPTIIPPRDEFPTDDHPLSPIDVSFAMNDSRIAGAITTSRFFNRYTTTELNKNRRRAAAVFNIFLCDPMSAAIQDPPATPDAGLDKAFPETSTITEGDIAAVTKSGDQHGADQACAKCHYKLDPVGQAFMMSPYSLSPLRSPGALVYKDDRTGKLVNEHVEGLGDLGAQISRQAQYERCQIRHFWNWFIGEDRVLTDARIDELSKEFDRVGRRTNDFVAVMVGLPEFRTREFRSAEEIRVANVKAVLGKCVACHEAAKIPDFNVWPIGGSRLEMKNWLGRISARLDLDHDGASKTMPPPWSGWQPAASDLSVLKAWIHDGAPDAKGQPQI